VFRWIAIGVGFITLLLVGYIVAAFIFPDFRVAMRDIFVTILAVLQLISAFLTVALLLAVLFAVNQINKLAKGSVMPKIDQLTGKLDEVLENTRAITTNVRDSASTATNTTVFVAERVASPVIRLASLVTGVRAAATALARRDEPNE
jgi:hypothetical protein